MDRKLLTINFCLVAVTLISSACSAQQLPQATEDSTPSLASVAATGTAPAATSTPIEEAAKNSDPFPRTSSSSRPASDSGEPIPIVPAAALVAVRAPIRQPARRVPLLRAIFGPRTEMGFFAVGNYNSTSFVHLNDASHGGQQIVSSNKSSFGGGAEYRWRLSDRNALGFLYVQNPSDGRLWTSSTASMSGASTQTYIWPLMRYDFSILATQSFKAGRITPFVSEGPGVVVTNGYDNSGWSAGFAFVAGVGTEYELNPRLSARTGITFLNTKGGCYDDPTCRETWGVVEDLRIGFVYKWGRAGLPPFSLR
jgi:hypothetical protein